MSSKCVKIETWVSLYNIVLKKMSSQSLFILANDSSSANSFVALPLIISYLQKDCVSLSDPQLVGSRLQVKSAVLLQILHQVHIYYLPQSCASVRCQIESRDYRHVVPMQLPHCRITEDG